MKTDLITLFFLVIFASALVLPGLSGYLMKQNEHELKIACINAGKDLVEGSCIGGETK